MKWPFRIVTALLAAALLAGVLFALRSPPIDVDLAQVVRAPLDLKVIDDGRARVRERYTGVGPRSPEPWRGSSSTKGTPSSRGSCWLDCCPLPAPLLDPRSRQVAGDHLASAIDAQWQAAATVSRAETAADQAHRELARVEALSRDGSLPPSQLDQADADARMRDAELASAHFSQQIAAHDIEQARSALQRFGPGASRTIEQFEVTSPVHGQVLHVLHKSEGVVEAGTALLELGDPRAMELVVDVLSQDAVPVHPGMPAVSFTGGRTSPSLRRCAASNRPPSPRRLRSAWTSNA